MPAASSVSLMRDVWEGPLGAVRPDDLPSWLTEDACTTATGSWLLPEAAGASTATAASMSSSAVHQLCECWEGEALSALHTTALREQQHAGV